jgi:L-ascorbate metabolism protein UlaG (beta-lactamase superfamily)
VLLTKLPHACLRLEKDERTLVVDPGAFSDPRNALRGADAVLITHEHPDHVDVDALREAARDRPGLAVRAHPEVLAKLGDVAADLGAVRPGDELDLAGFAVRAFGDRHALIHEDVPDLPNNAYLVDGRVYYPGDSFTVPDAEVDTLFVPVGAPWLKIAESIDFVRAVRPRQAHPTHDAVLSDAGQRFADNWVAQRGGADYRRLAIGEPVEL